MRFLCVYHLVRFSMSANPRKSLSEKDVYRSFAAELCYKGYPLALFKATYNLCVFAVFTVFHYFKRMLCLFGGYNRRHFALVAHMKNIEA